MKRRIGLFAALVIVLAAGSVLLAQSNPFVGTWKLNVASSKYNPGPPPQSQTRTWDAAGMVMVNGSRRHWKGLLLRLFNQGRRQGLSNHGRDPQ